LCTGLYFRAEIAEVGRQAQLDRIVIATACPEIVFIDLAALQKNIKTDN
jgi:hypothetical protein